MSRGDYASWVTRLNRTRMVAGLVLVLAVGALYWRLHDSGAIATVIDAAALKALVGKLGAAGPLAVIGLMILAILVSPIPSAPIALAAGALYGHAWGTLYVLLGAEIGALAAFAIARLAGHEVLRHWLGERLSLGWFGSQNALMGVVFASRLLPFVSFDVVSYAAGLTVLSWWRFAVATLAGILPASFLLAHFGAGMVAGEATQAMIAVLGLGALVAIPFVAKFVYDRRYGAKISGMSTDPIPLSGLAHIGIRVHDLERSVRFYALLGFRKTAGPIGPEPVAILEHPSGIELNLILNAPKASEPNVLMDLPEKHAGITHFALLCPDIAAAKARLEAAGIALSGGPVRFGPHAQGIFVRDPDRNVIELHQRG